MTAAEMLRQLHRLADPDVAEHARRFFKTGPGEYAEGDRFLGVRVPPIRRLAREARALALGELRILLQSEWHEARLLALIALSDAYRRAAPPERDAIAALYLSRTAFVNSWDLVDTSAPSIAGPHAEAHGLDVLDRLAASDSLWDRRIAILATLHFIRQDQFLPTLRIAETLRDDPHDLIHKATGWMLREVGKRDRETTEGFLRTHAPRMPRTMLRTAIERFPEPLRQQALHGTL